MRKLNELRAFNRFLRAVHEKWAFLITSRYAKVCTTQCALWIHSLTTTKYRIHSRLVRRTHECIQNAHLLARARTSLDIVGARFTASECVCVCSSVILCTTKYSCHGFSDSKALKNRLFGEMKFEIVVDTDSELSMLLLWSLHYIASAQHLFAFVFRHFCSTLTFVYLFSLSSTLFIGIWMKSVKIKFIYFMSVQWHMILVNLHAFP